MQPLQMVLIKLTLKSMLQTHSERDSKSRHLTSYQLPITVTYCIQLWDIIKRHAHRRDVPAPDAPTSDKNRTPGLPDSRCTGHDYPFRPLGGFWKLGNVPYGYSNTLELGVVSILVHINSLSTGLWTLRSPGIHGHSNKRELAAISLSIHISYLSNGFWTRTTPKNMVYSKQSKKKILLVMATQKIVRLGL